MPRTSRLRSVIEQTRREAKRLARLARQADRPGVSSVRFSGRRNIVVAANTGQPGSTQRVVAIQSTSIDRAGAGRAEQTPRTGTPTANLAPVPARATSGSTPAAASTPEPTPTPTP